MKPDPAPGRHLGEGSNLLALGMTFAAGTIAFALAGLWLDRRLGWTPALTIAGTVLGAVLSFLNVYWKLAALERRHRKERDG